ncbi:Uncharacterised protein [Mycobacteroides abscessus subsp. abscessus]|nr:Uncharacterised protein [Mycobacteroides abscessus subsp. abscessus]
MVSSLSSDSTFTRGVISSSALRSPNCSERSITCAVRWSSAPRWAEVRTREPSSCGERAERSSSAGSTPSLRTTQFAVPLRKWIIHLNTTEKPTIGPAVARAVASGLAMAMFLGTSSP